MEAMKSKLRSLKDIAIPIPGIGRKSKIDPDEKWSNQYRERLKNHLYEWVDAKSGGELVEVYEASGEEGVMRFARDKLEPLMYNDGSKPERITQSEFQKWRLGQQTALAGDTPEDIAAEEAFFEENFTEHEAQFRLNKRGIEGESIVHVLYGRDDPRCAEIAKILIKQYPGLANDIYEGSEMYGQNSLHLSIIHDDIDAVNFLLQKGTSVNQRANGRFFWPEDQKTVKRQKPQTNYVGYTYYGEYPLAFAATFGNKDIYDSLIQFGGDPNLQDTYGNTVLHICVINNSIEMYSYAVRHFERPADVDIVNGLGYTALTLASKLGRKEIFDEMLDLMKVEFWRFSDMACSAYPLTALDTIQPDGTTNWDSALMTIINGDTDSHLDMVDGEIVQRLLADKWKAFAKRKLIERLGMLALHLLTLCISVYLRPEKQDELLNLSGAQDIVRCIAEVCLELQCCLFLFWQQGSEIRTQGLMGYLRNLKSAPTKAIFIVGNIFILTCVPCRILKAFEVEEAFLSAAMPFSWIFLLFFARAMLLTGPFVQMIYRMIAGDMVRFMIIAVIFILSYSQAFYFVGKDIAAQQVLDPLHEVCPIATNVTDYANFPETLLTMFRTAMNGFNYDQFECAQYKDLTKILFLIYMITMPIMLINMLIAMMGNTYTSVISQAEKAWRKNWAQIVIVLERSIKAERLAKCQLEYSIKLADGKDGKMETRGLMVIKQTKKTKAKQRKQAVSNWKRLCRKVITTVHKDGLDRTKFLMHNAFRAGTPTLLDAIAHEIHPNISLKGANPQKLLETLDKFAADSDWLAEPMKSVTKEQRDSIRLASTKSRSVSDDYANFSLSSESLTGEMVETKSTGGSWRSRDGTTSTIVPSVGRKSVFRPVLTSRGESFELKEPLGPLPNVPIVKDTLERRTPASSSLTNTQPITEALSTPRRHHRKKTNDSSNAKNN